jgi:uncharacterized protein YbjT (DUF2867 family)
MTKTAFVVGATGLTGREVVRVLREKGIDTLAHVRPDSKELDRWRAEFGALGAEVDTTPFDEAKITARMKERDVSIVFALLGTTRKRAKAAASAGADASYEAIDYGLSALFRRAAEASGSSPRYVYLSAIGAKENAANPYNAVRGKLERELREGSIPYTIVQPSFILGPRDQKRAGESVGASVLDGALGVLGALGAKTMRDRYGSIQAADLAAALVRLALDPDAAGKTVTTEALR